MAMIYVKTKPGRRAFYEGKIIPTDKFVPVTDDPYIRRLIDHWEDLEVEGAGQKTEPAKASPVKQVKPVEKGPTPPVPGGGQTTMQPVNPPAPGTGAPPKTN